MFFTAADIARNFESRDNGRGKAYQAEGRVQSLSIQGEGRLIESLVQGTDREPYHVRIECFQRGPRIVMESECTCPVGYMCKHGAATMYEALAEETRQQERKRHPLSPMLREKNGGAPVLSTRLSAWLEAFVEEPDDDAPETGQESRLVYLLLPRKVGEDPSYQIFFALQQKLRDGSWTRPRKLAYQQILAVKYDRPKNNTPDDKRLIDLATVFAQPYGYSAYAWILPSDPDIIDIALTRLIGTGRVFIDEAARHPLTLGKPIEAALGWTLLSDGRQKPTLRPAEGELEILQSRSPWYVNPMTGEAGPLRCEADTETLSRFLRGDAVNEKEAEGLRFYMKKAGASVPAPRTIRKSREKGEAPKASLVLYANEAKGEQAMAFLLYSYGDQVALPDDPSTHYQQEKGDEIILQKRDKTAEKKLLQKVESFGLLAQRAPGLSPTRAAEVLRSLGLPPDAVTLGMNPAQPCDPRGLPMTPPEDSPSWYWTDFLHQTAPALRASGIDVIVDAVVKTEIIEPDSDDIDAAFTQSGDWWFSLNLGISVGGERIQLLPILVAMIRKLRSLTDIDKLAQAPLCYAPLPDGRQIALPGPRVYTILKTLIELFDDKALGDDGEIKVSADLAAAFLKLEAITSKRWLGEGHLRRIVEKLSSFEGIEKVEKPKKLQADLRPYQADGFNWLHFLGAYGLSGILADDMGLGKTIQALAYLLSLKEKKKLDKPCLVVMPTSLIANWESEAARFTPSLKTLTLHGKDRAGVYDKIPDSDIVFTTYPLLPRDGEKLAAVEWSVLILDEAQAIKNPAAKMTQAACSLQARQRLCLTGTPVENHLGEAWSLFTFLMPGLLGNHKKFTKDYRNPIEKNGDQERKDLLARRLRPFILRRLKTEVAKELPPKTEIIRRVSLSDDQRDLYEAVRHVMNDKVREEIAAKGIARSQIVILDALLKLRQTCCDPRLVKLEAAKKVKSSAKLEELMEMLPTLIEDGRKILLFSQFTSMLDLIKPALAAAKIPFVELRGTTKDRATPIKRFQSGETPLFLISLKAGGTGLNLTAADTVIHYDPWWNPSVENQATDRAHRIGQDKPVFVYKMIAEGTVEERILDLQAKKAGLAAALFGDKPGAAAKLTPEDLTWLMG